LLERLEPRLLLSADFGKLPLEIDPPSGYDFTAIVTGDTDGDGKNEIIAVADDYSSSRLMIYEKTGENEYDDLVLDFDLGGRTQEVTDSTWLAVGEIDNDGYDEIVVITSSGDGINDLPWTVHMFSRTGNNSWARSAFSHSNRLNCVAIGDSDSDGKPEIIVGEESGGTGLHASIVMWEREGTGFSKKYPFPTGLKDHDDAYINSVYAVTAGDSDGDGFGELIFATSSNQINVYERTTSNNSYTKILDTYGDGESELGIYGDIDIMVADTDKDTRPEIIWASDYYLYLMESDASHSWSNPSVEEYSLPCWGFSLDMGDVDGDGEDEIVIGGSYPGVVIYETTGNSTHAELWRSSNDLRDEDIMGGVRLLNTNSTPALEIVACNYVGIDLLGEIDTTADLTTQIYNADGAEPLGSIRWELYAPALIADTGNPGQFNGISGDESHWIKAYQNGGTLFGEELWYSQYLPVGSGTQYKELFRNLPFASDVDFSYASDGSAIAPGTQIPVGAEVTATVTVINDWAEALPVTVRLLVDRTGEPGYDHDLAMSVRTVPGNNGMVKFTDTFTVTASGAYSFAPEVTSTIPGNAAERTDSWSWNTWVEADGTGPNAPGSLALDGEDDTGQHPDDRITNKSDLTFRWSKPGDNGSAGTDSYYQWAVTPDGRNPWESDGAYRLKDGFTGDVFVDVLSVGVADESHDYTFWVQARDMVGNWGLFADLDFTVDKQAPDAPGDLVNPENPTTDVTPNVSWSAPTEAGSGIWTYQVEFDNSDFGTGADETFWSADGDAALSDSEFGGKTLAEDNWRWRVKAWDVAGNHEGTWSEWIPLTIGLNTAPNVESLSVEPDPVFYEEEFTLAATVSDPDSATGDTVERVEFYFDSNHSGSYDSGDVKLGEGTTGDGTEWIWTGWTNVPEGPITYYARAWDGEAWSEAGECSGDIADYGVTIITHGWQALGGEGSEAPGWTVEMGEAILARSGGGSLFIHDPGSDTDPWVVPEDFENTNAVDNEIVLVFNWAWESNDFENGWLEAAADSLFAAILDWPSELQFESASEFLRRPLHFIGHSRGAVLNSRVIARFRTHFPNLLVDHVTSLDPHPDPVFSDPPATIYRNTLWADTYWRADGINPLEPLDFDGQSIPGSWSLELNEAVLDTTYGFPPDSGHVLEHSDVHLWYVGTIDTTAHLLEGEAVTSYMEERWWNSGEAYSEDREPLSGRGNVGYASSRIGGRNGREREDNEGERGDPEAVPTVFNGSFDYGDENLDDLRDEIPGWERHGGDHNAHLCLSEGRLHLGEVLDADYTFAKHNPFYVPPTTTHLLYDYEITDASDDDTLLVKINGDEQDPVPLLAQRSGTLSVPLRDYQDTVCTVEFELKYNTWIDSDIYLDNIRLMDPGSASPSDIELSNWSLEENLPISPASPVVGVLSTTDEDVGDTFEYSLVAGIGDTDNSLFAIDGDELRPTVVFNYETAQTMYSVRVRSTDPVGLWVERVFGITITDANDAPTELSLSNATLDENVPTQDAVVGFLSTVDEDAGDTFSYTRVDGDGDADNSLFTISGNALRAAVVFDYELAHGPYSVRLCVTDSVGAKIERTFSIAVTDVNELPIDITLPDDSVGENQPVGTVVGVLSGTDPDVGQSSTLTFTLAPGYGDNSQFIIDPATKELKTDAVFDFESRNSYSIKVLAADTGDPALTYEEVLPITVIDINDPPTDIAISRSNVAENQPVGTVVGVLSGTDPDAGQSETLTFSLVSGYGDNSQFSIDPANDQLKTAAVFDHESKDSYDIKVRASDAGSPVLAYDEVFAITVTDVPDAQIAGRHVFYNNSSWDVGGDDDAAIALDKSPLLPGGTSEPANYTNYTRGINGIMVDIDDPTETPGGGDFGIRVSDIAAPDTWSTGPTPTVTVRPGEGVDGSDRVTLVWPDGAILNQWVEITVKSASNIGLAEDDVFSFCNVVADCDGDGLVGANDLDAFVGEFGRTGGIGALAADFDGDGRVGLADFVLLRSNFSSNKPPTVSLADMTTTLPEDADTSSRIKVADVVVADDGMGDNALSLSGADAEMFEIDSQVLYLKADSVLDFESNPALDVTVAVDDVMVGSTPDDTVDLTVSITDVNEPPMVSLGNTVTTLPEDTDTSSRIKVADVVITDDGMGDNIPSLSGADAAMFEIDSEVLYLKADSVLDFESNPALGVTVAVDDSTLGFTPDDMADLVVDITDVNELPMVSLANATTTLSEGVDTGVGIKIADIVVEDDGLGENTLSLSGADAAMFEIDADVLYLKAGAVLDHEIAPVLDVSVEVDDAAVGAVPDDTAALSVSIMPSFWGNPIVVGAQIQAGDEFDLYLITDTGDIIRNLTADLPGDFVQPSVSPDLTKVAFRQRGANNIRVMDMVSGTILSSWNVGGAGLFSGVDWLDNDTLMYAKTHDGVYSNNIYGTDEYAFPKPKAWSKPTPRLSPDGTRIVSSFGIARDDRTIDVYMWEIGVSANWTLLPSLSEQERTVVWGQDNDTVYYGRTAPPNTELRAIDVSAGTNTLITGGWAGWYLADASHNSDQLLTQWPGELRTVDPGTLAQVTIFTANAVNGAHYLGNIPPSVGLANTTTTLPEDADTGGRIKMADVVVTDDGLGVNTLSLSGADAAMFEIDSAVLYLKVGSVLDYEANPMLDVTVAVDDASVGVTPDDTANLSVSVTEASEPPTVNLPLNGLMAHWSFDETLADLHGVYDGTFHGGSDSTPDYVPGWSGEAIRFDGVDDYVSVPADDFAFEDSFTVSAWIQLADNDNVYRNFVAIAEAQSGDLYPHFSLTKSRSGYWEGRLYAEIYHDDAGEKAASKSEMSGDQITLDTWMHLAAVVDCDGATQQIQLFVDGVPQGQPEALVDALDLGRASELSFNIGGAQAAFHNSLIDEVAVWGRALSSEEIAGVAGLTLGASSTVTPMAAGLSTNYPDSQIDFSREISIGEGMEVTEESRNRDTSEGDRVASTLCMPTADMLAMSTFPAGGLFIVKAPPSGLSEAGAYAAVSLIESDLRLLSDDPASDGDVDDLLADILAESALALPL